MSGTDAFRSVRRAVVVVAVALLAAGGVWWGHGPVQAQAPAPRAQFAYVVMLPGWNLISPGGQDDISTETLTSTISGPLFTAQPGDRAYEQTTLDKVVPGNGYWAYFTDKTTIALNLSNIDSTTTNLAAGTCVIVGNPSTKGSAKVTGADHVYEFSAANNQYVETSYLGIGRGAIACNDNHDSIVSVAFLGAVISADWPNCCTPTPDNLQGQALVVFQNDSPAPITIGFRQMDQNGALLDPSTRLYGEIEGCSSCPEYTPDLHASQGCGSGAVTRSFPEAPGFWHLTIQSDAANQPDLVADVTVTANTKYTICYWVDATRPQ